jgi:hypothetical protein
LAPVKKEGEELFAGSGLSIYVNYQLVGSAFTPTGQGSFFYEEKAVGTE